MMPRNIGLFTRLTNGMRSFNWSRLLSGANKTLNVMNQTIPLIRQTKPMVNNMKSILKLAKAFRSETNNNHKINNIDNTNNNNHINNDIKEINHTNDYPTFFI